MAETEEELKSLLMKVKEESEKSGLTLKKLRYGIWPHYFMQKEWEKVEAVTDFLFLGSEITVDGDCSHEIRRQLLLGRQESYDKPRQCAESRDITADKGPYI